MAETETINRLFLELSQFTTAKTARELQLERQLVDALRVIRHLLPSAPEEQRLTVEGFCEAVDNILATPPARGSR